MIFIDTNIWIYATIVQDPAKRSVAQKIIRLALERDDFAISAQVIAECANTLFKKGGKGAPEVLGVMHWMESLPNVVAINTAIVKRAVEIKALYGISFYDAQIVAAAEKAGCKYIVSEDLSTKQECCGIFIVDPFSEHSHRILQDKLGD